MGFLDHPFAAAFEMADERGLADSGAAGEDEEIRFFDQGILQTG
jgi:hypothetical protein